MMPQARSRMACSAWCAVRMHSSRQMGVSRLRLQLGVVDDVVVAQRLLDHHQVEFVQLAQVGGIGQGVRRIGIRHQLDAGKALAHAPHHVHVPARLDLHLDALVAVGQLALDLFQKLFHGILNPDGNAAGDFAARAAADLLPQRHAFEARRQVPNGGLQAAARHVMAADVRRQRIDVLGAGEVAADDARRRVIPQNHPGRCGPLFVVKGILAGRHLAPARNAIASHFHQDHVALVGAAEAGLEEVHQRHADLPQRDAFDFHFQGSSR